MQRGGEIFLAHIGKRRVGELDFGSFHRALEPTVGSDWQQSNGGTVFLAEPLLA